MTRLALILTLLATTANALPICGSERHSCVVDGDTIWLNGVKIRLEGYDTPEINGSCPGEPALAQKATQRLSELLSIGGTIYYSGDQDRFGRELANITVQGKDVGDILISEGLARSWPDGREFWCE